MKKIYNSVEQIRDLVPEGKKIVLVGGCFDILHVAHLRLLEYAKKLGDILVVCILSDQYIQTYKDTNRPIIQQQYRAMLIEGLQCVDYVFISDIGSSDYAILASLSPDVLVFGLDKDPASILKLELKKARIAASFPLIQISYLDRFDEEIISTSHIINKIRNITETLKPQSS